MHKAEPVVLDETEPRLFEFRDCMREKWPGIRIGFCSINGFTDAHHYRRLGLPMLILGVEGEGSYEANESVRLDSLFEYENLLADYLFLENALLKACRKGHWHDAEVKVHGDQLVITHEDA